MIELVLSPGDIVRITLRDTDGEFLFDYAASESNRLRVTSTEPGNVTGIAGVIHEEEWDPSEPEDVEPCNSDNPAGEGNCTLDRGHAGDHENRSIHPVTTWEAGPSCGSTGLPACILPQGHAGGHMMKPRPQTEPDPCMKSDRSLTLYCTLEEGHAGNHQDENVPGSREWKSCGRCGAPIPADETAAGFKNCEHCGEDASDPDEEEENPKIVVSPSGRLNVKRDPQTQWLPRDIPPVVCLLHRSYEVGNCSEQQGHTGKHRSIRGQEWEQSPHDVWVPGCHVTSAEGMPCRLTKGHSGDHDFL